MEVSIFLAITNALTRSFTSQSIFLNSTVHSGTTKNKFESKLPSIITFAFPFTTNVVGFHSLKTSHGPVFKVILVPNGSDV